MSLHRLPILAAAGKYILKGVNSHFVLETINTAVELRSELFYEIIPLLDDENLMEESINFVKELKTSKQDSVTIKTIDTFTYHKIYADRYLRTNN